ncbi:MAG TPA: hypothetical protein VIO14_13925 [Dehalococcoidia bacterium]
MYLTTSTQLGKYLRARQAQRGADARAAYGALSFAASPRPATVDPRCNHCGGTKRRGWSTARPHLLVCTNCGR